MDKETLYIQQIIDGDVARYTWFVDTYKDIAFSIANRILGNDRDSEETVQDAFLQAYRNIRSFKGESRFSTWLYRIVVNNALTRLKKRQREEPYADIELAAAELADVESSYQELTAQEQTYYIGRAMERLRPEDRLVLTLYYLDEQSLGEIADITGIPKAKLPEQSAPDGFTDKVMEEVQWMGRRRIYRRVVLTLVLRSMVFVGILLSLVLPVAFSDDFDFGWAGAGWHVVEALGQSGKWVAGHVYFLFPLGILVFVRRLFAIK